MVRTLASLGTRRLSSHSAEARKDGAMAELPPGAAAVPEDVQSNVLLTTVDWIYNTGRTVVVKGG